MEKANLIFIDAEKDGITEKKFLENFYKVDFEEKVMILLDDIRLWNMLKIWRDISRPRLDLTSFGHWSGTGIVEWPDSFRPRFLGARAVRTPRSRWGCQVFRFEEYSPSLPLSRLIYRKGVVAVVAAILTQRRSRNIINREASVNAEFNGLCDQI